MAANRCGCAAVRYRAGTRATAHYTHSTGSMWWATGSTHRYGGGHLAQSLHIDPQPSEFPWMAAQQV